MINKGLTILTFCLLSIGAWAQHISGKVVDAEGQPMVAMIFVDGTDIQTKTAATGTFKIDKLDVGVYNIVAFVPGFQTAAQNVEVRPDSRHQMSFTLLELETELEAVTIRDSRSEELGISWLESVSGSAIYEAKKTELIAVDQIIGNKAANVGRQVYARVPGLNIWESDGAGINLGIGGRGLNPNRTSNFNVRQNGYDISADALGYPESYYTPPVPALRQIEVVRGAAGLQYGTQFGGMLNFEFKEGPKDRIMELNSTQTVGSFGLFNSFNSLGGTVGKLNYYTFYQYKASTGWRPNSQQNQHNFFGAFTYNFSPFLGVKIEHTHMTYLAQQPGGLTDEEFASNPKQSKRERNWFEVGWDLTAMEWNYRLSSKLKINNRSFLLSANRFAVGNLENIAIADNVEENRNLLKDEYLNFGNELRAVIHYDLFGKKSILVVGNRLYFGKTEREQGDGSSSFKADFEYVDQDSSNYSNYNFPNRNVAFFAENVFNLTDRFSLTPGIRYEYIKTVADGYYLFANKDLAGNVLSVQRRDEDKTNPRSFLIGGLGMSYKLEGNELYANISQNYRSINFNDIRVINPSLVVDENIDDEFGYNFDLGIRGSKKGVFSYDVSMFYLRYNQRIGATLNDSGSRFRTNIGDSYILGLESYGEIDWLQVFTKSEDAKLSTFVNLALIRSEYITSQITGVAGNEVELVPVANFKTGATYRKGDLGISYLFTYVTRQFTDATNATMATSGAVNGLIPSYSVMDLSADYLFKNLTLEAGINNVTDASYFTRRAAGYPGPGIIPANPRNFYVGLGVKF
ncbi:MAG: TonB-dependent receptor [Cyclobacteriaceae bacterium]